MDWKRSLSAALLAAAMVVSFMPAAVFAEGSPEADTPEVIMQEEGRVSVSSIDSDELLMQYIDQKVMEETGSDSDGSLSLAAVHKRRDVLGDVAGNMYDALAPSVRKVAAGDLSDTAFVVPASKIFGRAKYDAEDLGVKSIFDEEGNITAEAFNAFISKLNSDLSVPLSDMMYAMISDMPYELYWLDNVAGIVFELDRDWLVNNMLVYTDGSIGIEPDNKLKMTFSFYVSQDYSKGGSATQYGPAKTTKVDTDFTKAAANTAKNISGIIGKAKDKSDADKLYQYKDDICRLTSYNSAAMADPDFPYGDPWQLIYVFDGNPDTNVVCEGYSKAFQYLCDNTSFNHKNIESRLVSGEMTGDTKGGVVSGPHMWNILHMDDGRNYIADITNCDDDSIADDPSGYPDDVFLRGAQSGSVSSGYIYSYMDGSLKYQYGEKIHDLFLKEELTLSDSTYPYGKGGDDDKDKNTMKAKGKTVSLKAKALKNKAQTIAAKKAFSVSDAQGPVSYKLVKVNNQTAKKKFSITKKGKITVKKGLKNGTYKLTVKVTAAGNADFEKMTKKVTVTVKVK